jgi:Protein of unknwon function (DUF3008)
VKWLAGAVSAHAAFSVLDLDQKGNQPRRGKRLRGMPARSKKQQMAAGAALAAKRGKRKKSSLKGASKQMAKSMSEKQLRDIAKTKRKKLPSKKK